MPTDQQAGRPSVLPRERQMDPARKGLSIGQEARLDNPGHDRSTRYHHPNGADKPPAQNSGPVKDERDE
jgi:hypothetical protein